MWKWIRRRRWQLFFGMVLGFILWILMLPPEDRQRLEKTLGPSFSSVIRYPAKTAALLNSSLGRVGELWQSQAENERLREELALLKIEYHQLQESHLRSQRKKPILAFGSKRFKRLRPAALLARDPSSWFNLFRIDQGSSAGISSGDGILNYQGVVGKVVSVSENSAKALFITALESRISVRTERSEVAAVLKGDGKGGCFLEYLAGQDDVKVGDIVETSPIGLSFPSGVPVGEIILVEKIENGLKLRAELRPFAQLNRLDSLFVAGEKQ